MHGADAITSAYAEVYTTKGMPILRDLRTLRSEVFRSAENPLTEMLLRDAIDDDSGRERELLYQLS